VLPENLELLRREFRLPLLIGTGQLDVGFAHESECTPAPNFSLDSESLSTRDRAFEYRAVKPERAVSFVRRSSSRRSSSLRRAVQGVRRAAPLLILSFWRAVIPSFMNLSDADIGADTSAMLSGQVALPDRKYPGPDQRVAFFERLEERLNTISAIEAASVVSALPGMDGGARSFVIAGRPAQAGTQLPVVTTVRVGPRYFDALGAGPVRGRPLDRSDGLPGRENIVVNRRFAATHFPGEDPIGERIGSTDEKGGKPPDVWLTLVGVSPTVRQRDVGSRTRIPWCTCRTTSTRSWQPTCWSGAGRTPPA
jgi:hypothetical protein